MGRGAKGSRFGEVDPHSVAANLYDAAVHPERWPEALRGAGTPLIDEFGITRNTARLHLNRVLQKTGTRRQSELVRLLLGLAGRAG